MKKTALALIALSFAACDPGTVAETATVITKMEEEASKPQRKSPPPPPPSTAKSGLVTQVNPETKVKNEINYKDGLKDGESRSYYPNGALWKKTNYHQGNLHGLAQIFYEDGTLKREANYKDDQRDGAYTEFFKSGNPKFEASFKKGLPQIDYIERNYRGEEIKLPEIVHTTSKKRAGGKLNIRLTFKLEGVKLGRGSRVSFYVLPKGTAWSDLSMDDIHNYMLSSGEDEYSAFAELSLEPDYYLELEGTIVAVFTHHSDISVAVSEPLDLRFNNVSGPASTEGLDLGHE
jgi:hypothetical protein